MNEDEEQHITKALGEHADLVQKIILHLDEHPRDGTPGRLAELFNVTELDVCQAMARAVRLGLVGSW